MGNTPLLELSSLPKWNIVEITEASTENLIQQNVFLHGPKRKLQMNERNSLKIPKQKQRFLSQVLEGCFLSLEEFKEILDVYFQITFCGNSKRTVDLMTLESL